MELIDKAIKFAIDAHDGAFRKGTTIPYISHPLEVGTIASSLTDDEDVIAAAILHDTVEDAGVSLEEIEEHFNGSIALILAAESEDKREDLPAEATWQIRKEEALSLLRKINDVRVKQVALADKLSNIRAIYRDYNTLGDRIWDKFNQKDPEKHAWYYGSYLEICSELSETMAYMEYEFLLKKIFGSNVLGKVLLQDVCDKPEEHINDFVVISHYLRNGVAIFCDCYKDIAIKIYAYAMGEMLVLMQDWESDGWKNNDHEYTYRVFDRENARKIINALDCGTIFYAVKHFCDNEQFSPTKFDKFCESNDIKYNEFKYNIDGE